MTAIGLVLFLTAITILWVDEEIAGIPWFAGISAAIMLFTGLLMLFSGIIIKIWEIMP